MKLRPRALEGGRRQRREGQGKGKGEQNVPVLGPWNLYSLPFSSSENLVLNLKLQQHSLKTVVEVEVETK